MKKKEIFFLLILLIASLLPRLFFLDEKSTWLDENFSLIRATGSASAVIKNVALSDAHPPFYYLLLKYWKHFLGNSIFVLRLLSSIFDIASIIFLYFLLKLFLCEHISFFIGLSAAFSCYLINYAQEIRHYSLVNFLGIFSTYLFLKMLTTQRKKYIIFYSISIICGLYTFYYLLFLYTSHFLFFLYLILKQEEYRSLFRLYFLSFCVSCFLFLPWIFFVIPKKLAILPKGKMGYLENILSYIDIPNLSHTFILSHYFPISITSQIFCTLFLCIAILYPFFSSKKQKEDMLFQGVIVSSLALPILFLLIFPFKGHIFDPKHLIFVVPYFFCVFGILVKTFKKTSIIFLSIIMILNIISLPTYYKKEKHDWAQSASYVYDSIKTGEIICFNPYYIKEPFLFYYIPFCNSGYMKRFIPAFTYAGENIGGQLISPKFRKYTYLSKKDVESKAHKNLWLIEVHQCHLTPPNTKIKKWCQKVYKLEKKKVFPGILGNITIFYFTKKKIGKGKYSVSQ